MSPWQSSCGAIFDQLDSRLVCNECKNTRPHAPSVLNFGTLPQASAQPGCWGYGNCQTVLNPICQHVRFAFLLVARTKGQLPAACPLVGNSDTAVGIADTMPAFREVLPLANYSVRIGLLVMLFSVGANAARTSSTSEPSSRVRCAYPSASLTATHHVNPNPRWVDAGDC
jgi:hypothetical protein